MPIIPPLFVTIAAIFMSLFVHGAHAHDLVFGIYANDKATELVRSFRPLLDFLETHLTQDTGKKYTIRMKIANSYEQGVDDLVEGVVDFARFGPASYIEAKSRQAGIEILAIETLKGKKNFYGVICVHEDSDITDLKDLKGKRFAFGARESTIGRYLAQSLFVREGILAKDLAYYEYLGRHDKVGAAVAARLFDAGAMKEDTFQKMRAGGQPLKKIAVMENATKPWLARRGLSKVVFRALQTALLRIRDFSSLDEADGMAMGSDHDYQAIRDALKDAQRFER